MVIQLQITVQRFFVGAINDAFVRTAITLSPCWSAG